MTLFSGLVGGGLGGGAGAAAGHVLVTALGGGLWLKGPYGPPFFDAALDLAVMFAGMGLALGRRTGPALLGLAGPFALLALPMAVLTRTARWGQDGAPTLAWFYAVGGLYSAATWGTVLALGAALARGPRWKGALGGAAGAFSGYLALAGFLKVVPSYAQVVWSPAGWVPSPVALLNGLLTGAGLGAGVYLFGRKHEPQASVG